MYSAEVAKVGIIQVAEAPEYDYPLPVSKGTNNSFWSTKLGSRFMLVVGNTIMKKNIEPYIS